MDIKHIVPFCMSMICFSIFGQHNGSNGMDSLKGKSYEYLLDKIESEEREPFQLAYGKAYLQKAKSEKNWTHLVNAYRELLHLSDKKYRILFADSMLIAARRSKDDDLIGSAYLTKGIVYYDLQEPNSALDNYLAAEQFLAHSEDQYLRHKVKYNIAQIKYYLGYYNEALALFKENIAYFEKEDDIPYLTSLHSMALCYNRLGYLELCSKTNQRGIKEATEREYYPAIPRFVNSEGINQYFRKNYSVAIAKLTETLPAFSKSNDYMSETVTNFYLGKSYLALNQTEKAIPYFLKVDKAFTDRHYTNPDLREAFEILIKYYKSKGDLKNHLKYIDHLFLADKYLNPTYKYLSGRIHKEYDTKKLIAAKNEAEQSLAFQKIQNFIYVGVILLLVVWLGYMIYKARENKRKFKKLMERKALPKLTAEEKIRNTGSLTINPDVIASVLKHLDKFESSEKFLAKDITLPKLAKMFDSNIVYVSKIIAHSRQKKSTDYINDLKVEYIMNRLRENSKLRNYTNKALAEEAGFSTTQHFTRAFHKNTGISPTYFVQELKKSIAS